MRLKKKLLLQVGSILFGASGLVSFASVALSEEAAGVAAPTQAQAAPANFVSDGSSFKFDQGRASISPIKGWMVEPNGSGVSVVMKEVLPPAPAGAHKDYSQPIFARNITVMTINEGSPIDEQRAAEFKENFLKMAAKQGSMPDLQFTSQKFFNFKGENDGLVFFTQHTSNGFTMMQMHVLVSGESRQYLMTYNDLASRFSNQETYDQAWKTMTSIDVQGVPPVRYMREAKIGGSIFAGFLLLVLPFSFARFMSQRRLRKVASSLQDEWDTGTVSGSDEWSSNVSALETTRVAGRVRGNKKRKPDVSEVNSFESSVSSFGSNFISTHKSRFATEV